MLLAVGRGNESLAGPGAGETLRPKGTGTARANPHLSYLEPETRTFPITRRGKAGERGLPTESEGLAGVE